MLRDKFLVVEFSDLLFRVKLEIIVVVPLNSIDFFEQVPLFLANLWRWSLCSLAHIEWKRKELLSVR